MKKVLSFILVLSMVLSSFGMAFAAPATSEIAGHLNEKATLRLNKLGIVQGDDRGFALDSNITRAEFAVLLVRALGLEGSANVSKGETQFTDVTVAAGYEWASGAINVATRLGYIQGYGNGKFGPADNIRYEDAITLIIRALGYEPAAQAKGGYPVGYLVVAEQEVKNTDHVKGAAGVPITRGSVFQLLDNSLTKALMIQVGYGSETKYVVSGQKGTDTEKQTILTNKLGIEVVEGVVTANYRVDKLKANEIKIGSTKYEVSEEFDVDALLGLEISAWQDKDDVLFRYEVETDEEQVIYDTLTKVEEKTKSREDYLVTTPVVLDSEIRFNEDAVVYVNNEKEAAEDFVGETLSYYGRIVLDEYNEVIFAYLFDFDKVGMAQEIKNDELHFVNVAIAGEDSIDLDDVEEVFVFNPDFTEASLNDIEAGTALFTWEDEDDNLFIVIKDDRVEGTLEAVRVRDNRVTVGGKNITRAANAIYSGNEGDEYKFWKEVADFEEVENFIDEDVIVVRDLTGKALVLTTDASITSSTIYGIATYLSDTRNPVLTVFTSEGKEVEYGFEDRKDAVAALKVNHRNDEFVAVSFKLNKDGEIAEGTLKTVGEADYYHTVTLEKGSKQKFVQIAGTTGVKDRFDLRTNTVFIKAKEGTATDSKLKPSVIKYDDIIGREFGNNAEAIVIGEKGKDAKLVVFTNPTFEATNDKLYGLVTGDVIAKNRDFRVNIYVAGEGEAEYVVPTRNSVRKGDLIEFKLNNKGEATGIVIKVEASDKDKLKDNAFKVTDKDGDYLEIDGSWKLVDSDTVIYETNDKGNLNSKPVGLSRVAKGDSVVYMENGDGGIAVLVVVSKYYEAGTGTNQPGLKLEGTVTAKVYEIDGTTVTFEVVEDAEGTQGNGELAKFEVTENTALIKTDGTIIEGIRQITLFLRNKIGTEFELDVLKGGKIDVIVE